MGAATAEEARSDEARRANEANILSKELARKGSAGEREREKGGKKGRSEALGWDGKRERPPCRPRRPSL
jgi:hypothetical protein